MFVETRDISQGHKNTSILHIMQADLILSYLHLFDFLCNNLLSFTRSTANSQCSFNKKANLTVDDLITKETNGPFSFIRSISGTSFHFDEVSLPEVAKAWNFFENLITIVPLHHS